MADKKKAIILNDEDLERPLYTGIGKRDVGYYQSSTPSKDKPRAPVVPPPPASQSSSSETPRRQASAYAHIPVNRPVTTQAPPSDAPQHDSAEASQAPNPWRVPLQQVCKDGATPTHVCGKWSTAKNDPPKQPKGKGGDGPYKCPRCKSGFSRIDMVRQHFPSCIATNGNPECDAWTDDDSYEAGRAARKTTRTDVEGETKDRKPPSKASHFVELGICELIVRITTHANWKFFGLEAASGEVWQVVRKTLREKTRNGQEISPENEYVIRAFKEQGVWESEREDEA